MYCSANNVSNCIVSNYLVSDVDNGPVTNTCNDQM